jgi:hypothetical protein
MAILLSSGLGYPETQGLPQVEQKNRGPQDDEMLAAKLEEKLRMDQRINWQTLQVSVTNGQVKLHGVVKTPEEKGFATQIVTSEPGVKAFANSIIIQGHVPDTEKKPDLKDKDGRPVLEGEGEIKEQQILP